MDSPESTTKTIRIALLVCGGLTGKAYARNGDYYDVYYRFLHESAPRSISFILDPYDVVREMAYPSEDEYDCIMLTGSAASAYENIEWVNKLVEYVARVAETKPDIKIIGICFGHQIIGRALGGECVPNGGRWEVGPTPIQLTGLGKRLFGGADKLSIQQMHRDHVPTVLPNFHLLASTKLSPNQGMVRFAPSATSYDPSSSAADAPLPPIQILTTQGHPEFTESIVTPIIEQRAGSGVIDAEAVADAERRRFWKTDGVEIVGKTMWEVMLQAK